MMKAKLVASAVALAALAPVSAGAADKYDALWVLIGVDVFQGAVSYRDTEKDTGIKSPFGEGLPVFGTQAACQNALRRAIRNYAGKSHAEGNYGRYICINHNTMQSSNN